VGPGKIAVNTAWKHHAGRRRHRRVIDTGVDYGHPDIATNIWQNPGEIGTDAMGRDKRTNGVDDDGNGYVDDWRGYNFGQRQPAASTIPWTTSATAPHVAGTIAAVGNNAAGIVGASRPARRSCPSRVWAPTAAAARAIWPPPSTTRPQRRQGHQRQLGRLRHRQGPDADSTPSTSPTTPMACCSSPRPATRTSDMGSEALSGSAAFYPGAALNAVAVGATTHLDTLSSFSNFGMKVDVVAPGGGDNDSGVVSSDRSILSLLSSRANTVMTAMDSWWSGRSTCASPARRWQPARGRRRRPRARGAPDVHARSGARRPARRHRRRRRRRLGHPDRLRSSERGKALPSPLR